MPNLKNHRMENRCDTCRLYDFPCPFTEDFEDLVDDLSQRVEERVSHADHPSFTPVVNIDCSFYLRDWEKTEKKYPSSSGEAKSGGCCVPTCAPSNH